MDKYITYLVNKSDYTISLPFKKTKQPIKIIHNADCGVVIIKYMFLFLFKRIIILFSKGDFVVFKKGFLEWKIIEMKKMNTGWVNRIDWCDEKLGR